MKTLSFWGLKLMAILLMINFISCSKDDTPSNESNLPVEEKNIIGQWECIKSFYSSSEEEEQEIDDYVEARLIFNGDGTGIIDESPVEWSLKNNELYVTAEDMFPLNYIIESLTSNTMTIVHKVTEGDYWEQEKMILERR